MAVACQCPAIVHLVPESCCVIDLGHTAQVGCWGVLHIVLVLCHFAGKVQLVVCSGAEAATAIIGVVEGEVEGVSHEVVLVVAIDVGVLLVVLWEACEPALCFRVVVFAQIVGANDVAPICCVQVAARGQETVEVAAALFVRQHIIGELRG